MRDKVYISSCETYEIASLVKLVNEQFEALSVTIQPGMNVVLKPNLVMKSAPDSGIITHPNFVAAVGLCVQQRGGKVMIAESSGGPYTPAMVKSIFAGCGYTKIAEEYGFTLYTACKSSSVELKNARLCKRLSVIEPFLEADYIINLAKLKSHCMTMLSGSVKNLFGTVPGLMKPELHCRFPNKSDFAQMLVDLCEYITPHFNMIDAIDAMEGDGPTGGEKRHVGAVISSKNPYAADMAAAAIIHMEPKSVLYLSHAMERKLCPDTVAQLTIMGDSIASHVIADFKQPKSKSVDFIDKVPKPLRPLAKKVATPKPVIRQKDCVGCGKCAESCPKHTITIQNKKAVISYNTCIHCFCCHEMCPLHVIDVKRFSLFNL